MSHLHIKSEIRILGIDDSALIDQKITIIGAFFRGGLWLDGVLSSKITRDGMDATQVIISMIKSSKHYAQIRALILDGITYAGFNPVDIVAIYQETKLPVIVYMRKYPDFKKIKLALNHFSDGNERYKIIEKAGIVSPICVNESSPEIFIQRIGISLNDAKDIIQLTSTRGNVPEPLRVAHLIATGIVCGESRGKS
ncbi:DUF99 family protein [Methanosalsum natronophilum]|uniref:UPF0215 protein D5R95_00785 n=1 Tax=Methanosalsum natronophilum TaxID=768733 RepID=A0A3R8CE53_9EURY|nr:MAG: DUF99 family protein [Methanosalsum natronophilum]